jgi:excinuclease ABC subunit C
MDVTEETNSTGGIELSEKARNLPDKPGVYIMKSSKKRIIYVGKAKSLKKRVRSYFMPDRDIKTRMLMENAVDLEFIITRNEYEALILENNLIKQWSPRFNINLKDGKTYPVIRITNEPFPRVFRTRRIIFDGSEYYGPFPDVGTLDLYMTFIRRMFPLRHCKGALRKRQHPCLYYHIKQCSAPCCGLITESEYAKTVDGVRKLLTGKVSEIKAELDDKMRIAAADFRYEEAAVYRDQMQTLDHFTELQRVVDFSRGARDYIGFYTLNTLCTFVVLKHREGNISGREIYQTRLYSNDEDALVQFILQYYGAMSNNLLPSAVFLPIQTDTDVLSSFFNEKMGKKIEVRIPAKGEHFEIVNSAIENAKQDIEVRKSGLTMSESLEELRKVLGIEKTPLRIEGFDISHLGGRHTVASMVSFENGLPDKGSYRYFKMKSLEDGRIDDYESIREAVARRYTRVINDDLSKPDLILIDGGKGQLNAALGILKALGLGEIPVLGLAKKNEEIFTPQRENPIILERTSSALRILTAVRDESHRFATGLNKRLRKKSVTRLLLEEIPGIGPKKSTMLLKRFGSIKAIISTEPAILAKSAKIKEESAVGLIEYLKSVYRE